MKKVLMVMVVSLVVAASAFAAGDKIAFVDTQTVFDKTKLGKKYQGVLKEYFDSRKKILDLDADEIQKLREDYGKQSAVLKPEIRKEREETISRKISDFEKKRSEFNNELAKKNEELSVEFNQEMMAILKDLAKKEKIAVTGRSHGGYLTMTCMTMYPELWAAGSAVVPFLNWIKSHKNSREDLQHWNIENMGDPEDNHELWIARSPYFFLDKVSAPVQLICGGNDPRCPASDSIDARDKLVELGREVEFLLYKDEGHSFLDIENVIDAEEKCVEFLAKALER